MSGTEEEHETGVPTAGRRRRRVARSAAAAVGLLLVAVVGAACGSAASQSLGTTTTSSQSSSGRTAAFQAYRQCLAQHGAPLPAFTGRPPGTPRTPGSPPPSFTRPNLTPQQQAAESQARAACQSKRPAGGFDGRRNGALTRYLNCMRSKGIALGQGATVNRNDPAFIAANQQCRQYLPGAGSPPPASS